MLDTQEVTGSSPVGPTTQNPRLLGADVDLEEVLVASGAGFLGDRRIMVRSVAYELTREELEERLRDQVGFIRASAAAFDQGATPEMVRLAISIRILVHDNPGSPSLLSQLDLQGSGFLNTAPDLEGLTWSALTKMQLSTDGTTRFPAHLGDLWFKPTIVSFDDWWHMPVIVDGADTPFTRRDLVLGLANKEGGAHVDPKLEPEYAALSRSGSLGWVIVEKDGSRPLLENPIPGSVRQIAYEVDQTLVEIASGIIGSVPE